MNTVITEAGFNNKYTSKELESLYTGKGYSGPLISVVVPIFNVEEYLRQCIESILNQTFKNLEIILVDDGSPDSCPQICDEYARSDSRIKVIHKNNGGLVSARRAGVILATGDFITFVDGDDWIENNAYESMMQGTEKGFPDVIISVLYYKDYDNGQSVMIKSSLSEGCYSKKEFEQEIYSGFFRTDIFFESDIPGTLCTSLFKCELQKYIYSKMDDRISIGEDAICLWMYYLSASSMHIKKTAYYHYRQHQKSMLHSSSEKDLNGIRLLNGAMETALLDAGYNNEQWYKKLDYFTYYILFLTNYHLFLKISLDFLFPFCKVKKGSKIILYSAGTFGMQIKKNLEKLQNYTIVKWVDMDYLRYQESDFTVDNPATIHEVVFDYIVVAVTRYSISQQIKRSLVELGIQSSKIALIDNNVLTHDNLTAVFYNLM